jgi:hypothetical protein
MRQQRTLRRTKAIPAVRQGRYQTCSRYQVGYEILDNYFIVNSFLTQNRSGTVFRNSRDFQRAFLAAITRSFESLTTLAPVPA